MERQILELLTAIARQADDGELASDAYLAQAIPRPDLAASIVTAQQAALIGRAGRPRDIGRPSPIRRADAGWMLLNAGERALGREPSLPLDASPLD